MDNRAHQQRIYYVVVRRSDAFRCIIRAIRGNYRTAAEAEAALNASELAKNHGAWVMPYTAGRPVSESNLPAPVE